MSERERVGGRGERERESVRVCMHVCVRVTVCVHACVRMCIHACVCPKTKTIKGLLTFIVRSTQGRMTDLGTARSSH